jgi:hypothetical protein
MGSHIVSSLAAIGVHTWADLAGYSRSGLAAVWTQARVGRLDALERGLRSQGLTWASSGYAARPTTARPPWLERPSSAPRGFEFASELESYVSSIAWLATQQRARIEAAGGGEEQVRIWLAGYVRAEHVDAAAALLRVAA